MDPNTKYLTFLPHSGFHNQRTELENALLLARLLNRTLILPKVYLGPPMPWLTFRQLHARLLYQTKIGLEHCRAIIEGQKEKEHDEAPLPAACLQYESWTMTDWDLFFDLNPLRRYVRILTRDSMAMTYLAARFNLTIPTEEVTNMPNLYDYRFTENPMANESIRTRPKFRQEFTIEWLKGRPERLIHLGSIFGTGRISIDSLESKAWLLMIRDHLILQTDILQTTTSFLDSMEVGFVGVHVRMSDGHFSLAARDTIENIRQELILTIEQCRALALNHHRKLQNQLRQQQQWQQQQPAQPPPYPIHYHEQQQDQRAFTPSEATPSDKNLLSNSPSVRKLRRSNGRFTPIYLATDAHQPRANPIFNRLFRTFDCVFSLDDFSEDLEVLHQFRNPEDGTLMANFLIPMVDAMVVAKSAAFFGTPASTFSNYIQRQLRPAYTGLYD
ncbi:hypothetical protein BCR41DRAFT_406918 [Lobosporangium transversale]|uniref:GDP-fucose protein O-fucosyltransferase-domain-containing protein n=1 Tax=Lobosporangium transversale TaxID=64571 RepID=A0A1Y2GM49_9FUNG|nr:hypothetical protein BCR41DRAFT_406918 [Lobosporangium transversale]ORZ14931.1 hypothetical protein BCR41DRAFT_406918 [Lobosporangium transversale]|eukprot:XP_021881063.1 hypothetical protein BCR41DRAFT_406918 [Lobosporangium transversale]